MLRLVALVAALGAAASADAAPLRELGSSESARDPHAQHQGKAVTHVPVNQRFGTLDEYLAFLEKASALDKAWYREIKPGVYRLETSNLRGPYEGQRVFTREELERKFGFAR